MGSEAVRVGCGAGRPALWGLEQVVVVQALGSALGPPLWLGRVRGGRSATSARVGSKGDPAQGPGGAAKGTQRLWGPAPGWGHNCLCTFRPQAPKGPSLDVASGPTRPAGALASWLSDPWEAAASPACAPTQSHSHPGP